MRTLLCSTSRVNTYTRCDPAPTPSLGGGESCQIIDKADFLVNRSTLLFDSKNCLQLPRPPVETTLTALVSALVEVLQTSLTPTLLLGSNNHKPLWPKSAAGTYWLPKGRNTTKPLWPYGHKKCLSFLCPSLLTDLVLMAMIV
uniref:Uncharacterized protein n=1 Tax=Opuntia streptacantha TaxID=393608 RepID=A0A7C9EM65_OPUST